METTQIIKELRKSHGLTQTDLGNILNCDRFRIADIERGKTQPNIQDIIKLSCHFNVSTDFLLGLREHPTKNADIQMIHDYTGLSEKAINILNENEIKITSLNERTGRLFDQKIALLKKQKESLPKEEYELLMAKAAQDLSDCGYDDDVEELYECECIKEFLEQLLNSSSFRIFCIYTSEAIFYQAKELKLERYKDYLEKGYCKLSIELDEFKKAAANGIEVDMNYEDDNTDSNIYRAIKKYMRLIVDISNAIAENGKLVGSFNCDEEEENVNADN